MKELFLEYKDNYPEEHSVDLFLDLLNENNCYSRLNTSRHFTASAWIFNQDNQSVLLCHHRKLDLWIQVGGHADGDHNLEAVARKECYEESGLFDLEMIPGIFDIDIHTFPKSKDVEEHEHYDVRFLFIARNPEIKANHEVKDLKWVKLEDVVEYNKQPSVLRMAAKTTRLIDSGLI